MTDIIILRTLSTSSDPTDSNHSQALPQTALLELQEDQHPTVSKLKQLYLTITKQFFPHSPSKGSLSPLYPKGSMSPKTGPQPYVCPQLFQVKSSIFHLFPTKSWHKNVQFLIHNLAVAKLQRLAGMLRTCPFLPWGLPSMAFFS